MRTRLSAFGSFLDHLRYEKRYSQHTLVAYKADLESLARYLDIHYELSSTSEATTEHLRSYLVHLHAEMGLKPRSIGRKLSSLRRYYKYLLRNKEIIQDPTEHLKNPKIARRVPQQIKSHELAEAMKSLAVGSDFESTRDHVILRLLYETGIRRAELIELKVSDIDPKDRKIKVLGKRAKERIIPLRRETMELLEDYMRIVSQTFPDCESSNLILTCNGHKAYPKLIYNVVRARLGMFTSSESISPHALRHSFASHLSENGAELNGIKELLGHSSLAATQIYTNHSIDFLRRSYRQSHPRSGAKET